LKRDGTIVFEGAQGVLLDQDFGFTPHVTWTRTTFENADVLIKEAGSGVSNVTRMGVLRSYMTRHGAGPLVTESALNRPEAHNDATGYQGAFRTGELDFPALTYAMRTIAGVDELAVTHMDRIPEHVCLTYTKEFRPDAEYLATCRPVYHRLRFHNAAELLDIIESELVAPVTLTSYGPKTGDKRGRK
jgi:adenylosuccinate synthase